MNKWLRLTVPKSKRKKRAHKKWLKKTGTWSWLRTAEEFIETEMEDEKIHEKTIEALQQVAITGSSIIKLDKDELTMRWC